MLVQNVCFSALFIKDSCKFQGKEKKAESRREYRPLLQENIIMPTGDVATPSYQ